MVNGVAQDSVDNENSGNEDVGLSKTKSYSEMVPDWDNLSKKDKKKMRKKIRKSEKKVEHKQERKVQKKENIIKKNELKHENKKPVMNQVPKKMIFDNGSSAVGSDMKSSFSLFDTLVKSKNVPDTQTKTFPLPISVRNDDKCLDGNLLSKSRSEMVRKTQTYDLGTPNSKVATYDDSILKKRTPENTGEFSDVLIENNLKFKREKRTMVRALKRSQEYLDKAIEKLYRNQSVRYVVLSLKK
jgi:hypothetical protein